MRVFVSIPHRFSVQRRIHPYHESLNGIRQVITIHPYQALPITGLVEWNGLAYTKGFDFV